MSPDRRYPSLEPGYFLAQEAMSVSKDALFRQLSPYFQQFRTEDGVKRFFEQVAGKVDGLDYVNYWYTQDDAPMAQRVAEIARDHGVDLWTGIRWQKQFRDLPPVPAEFAAWRLDGDGSTTPALWEDRNQFLDLLNPDAVHWFCDVLEERYWPHMKGLIQGLFLPETRVPLFEYPWNRGAVNAGALYAYSPYVLGRWRKYCAEHDVRHEGRVVDRFPVVAPQFAQDAPTAPSVTLHGITMHADRSQNVYVPDTRPTWHDPFTRLAGIPGPPPVWAAWETFLCGLFHEAFLKTYAKRTNDLHKDVADWRGVCFFNHDGSTIDHRDFRTRDARTTACSGHVPQARRMGVDIHRTMDDPEYTCFIMETVMSPREYLGYDENNLSCFKRIAEEHGRAADFGFLLHYCCWDMDDKEEELRWEMIHRYRPPVLSMYTVVQLLTEDGLHYKPDAAKRFWERLDAYKRSLRSA